MTQQQSEQLKLYLQAIMRGGLILFALLGFYALIEVQRQCFLVLRPGNLGAAYFSGQLLIYSVALWGVFILAFGLVAWAGWKKNRDVAALKKWGQLIGMAGIGSILAGLAGATFINCQYDKSPVTSRKAEVTGRRIQLDNSSAYWLHVTDWKNPDSFVMLSVPKKVFDAHENSRELIVQTKTGLLGQEWLVGISAASG